MDGRDAIFAKENEITWSAALRVMNLPLSASLGKHDRRGEFQSGMTLGRLRATSKLACVEYRTSNRVPKVEHREDNLFAASLTTHLSFCPSFCFYSAVLLHVSLVQSPHPLPLLIPPANVIMVRIREIPRTAAFAWSPDASAPWIATGTKSGAVDVDFSNETCLELWDLALDSAQQGQELQPAITLRTETG